MSLLGTMIEFRFKLGDLIKKKLVRIRDVVF